MWGDQGLADCFQLEQPDSFNDKVLKQMTVNTFILTNRLFFYFINFASDFIHSITTAHFEIPHLPYVMRISNTIFAQSIMNT